MVVQRRLPVWMKVPMPGGPIYSDLKKKLKSAKLHTVCEEAMCPNIGDCWERKTATFMILGDICTRACSYCAVKTGMPSGLDLDEPNRLAETVEKLGLKYAVITSVNRDDLPDGGSFIFSQCIKKIRKKLPNCKIEVLIPDFCGNWDSLKTVIDANPETLNHNIETVERVFPRIRAKGDYKLSLELLDYTKKYNPKMVTKSGMMVGLGETLDEIIQTMKDLRSVGCNLLTIGQYLRPSQKHVALSKWYTPSEFEELADIALNLGFDNVASGPLVRSSYHADEQHTSALTNMN
ncbi:MAG: lipoyl synthase [Chloroflexi bacterium]|nr:lipoyl synthase [Chloroflexota bacterium]|tara:strand:- start:24529 stop:25404 length:876 start_codon:yes stop_codon:yes gene_type:complete